jgi:hypothetical protein
LAWGTLLVIALLAILSATPSGHRLTEGFTGSSQAAGTVSVRKDVWEKVMAFTLHDYQRTAVGVGFGRDFIRESGSRPALEGSIYQNVRSPHNYLVGTFARLGVVGSLLAALVIGLGCSLALTALRRPSSPSVLVLAALVAIAVPIVAMLGVVLESPFGALPYFWAVGELARADVDRRRSTAISVDGGSELAE